MRRERQAENLLNSRKVSPLKHTVGRPRVGPEAETPDTGALVQSLLRSRFCMPQQRVHIAETKTAGSK